MIARRRNPKRRPGLPGAVAVLVLAIAMGSAAIWVTYATPAPDAPAEPAWWPGLGMVPTR